jgi:hypothetical protein
VKALPATLRTVSPAEVAERLATERRGLPFLVYLDGDRRQRIIELRPDAAALSIGRDPRSDVSLGWDSEVSRAHAVLERVGDSWTLIDDGLSRNGSYVNGQRIAGRRRLRDGDRLCFGETPMLFYAPAHEGSLSTAAVGVGSAPIQLTESQRVVLVALCRPMKDSAYATPASNREIAEEVHLSVDAVKAHLRVIFERLDLDDLPQNQKRASLALSALRTGVVSRRDL